MISDDLPGGGEVVVSFIDDVLAEDLTGLLSLSLANVVVLDFDTGYIASVAWNDAALTRSWALLIEIYRCKHGLKFALRFGDRFDWQTYFEGHVSVGGPVEVATGPSCEGILDLGGLGPLVIVVKLGVRLEEA